jgi:hypothetical protein
MMDDHESTALFCKQMGFEDESELQDWVPGHWPQNQRSPAKEELPITFR